MMGEVAPRTVSGRVLTPTPSRPAPAAPSQPLDPAARLIDVLADRLVGAVTRGLGDVLTNRLIKIVVEVLRAEGGLTGPLPLAKLPAQVPSRHVSGGTSNERHTKAPMNSLRGYAHTGPATGGAGEVQRQIRPVYDDRERVTEDCRKL
jgi:hypothetical protein